MHYQPEYLVLFVPHVLFAFSVHEAAHAYVAYLLGDDTAALLGRVTLNPTKHIDLFGAAAFLFIGLGWAKPTPVNRLRLRHPRRDDFLISLAGPAANLLTGLLLMSVALVLYYFVRLRSGPGSELLAVVLVGVNLNLGLFLFNLLPAPPLDGSHMLMSILPERAAAALESLFARGFLALLAIIILSSFAGWDLFGLLVWGPAEDIARFVLGPDAYRASHQALAAFVNPGG